MGTLFTTGGAVVLAGFLGAAYAAFLLLRKRK
jgi:hypothetical protein